MISVMRGDGIISEITAIPVWVPSGAPRRHASF
jgi:hypothetical protein